MKESRIGHTHLYLTIILDSSTNFVLVHIFCWKAGEGGGGMEGVVNLFDVQLKEKIFLSKQYQPMKWS